MSALGEVDFVSLALHSIVRDGVPAVIPGADRTIAYPASWQALRQAAGTAVGEK